jgi:hypothetical protein
MSICYSPILPPTPKEEPKSEEYFQGREEALSQVSKWLRARRAHLVSTHSACVKPSPQAEMLASRIYEIDFLIDDFNNGAYVPKKEPTP